jgi:DNA polymerase elongation subunit (family B)
MNLYVDIETIPSQSPEVHAAIAETITPPGNISKAETIAAWNAEKKPALIKEAIAKTALDGSVGHICCIGLAANGSDPMSHSIENVADEARVLDHVLNGIAVKSLDPIRIVGHNVIGFDIRFIWQRAIVLGVHVPSWFPRDPKPWSGEVFDTMLAFAGQRGMISLDRLCRALGIPGKDDIDGSMVASLWEAHRSDDIARYCMDDVERTRAVHRRMAVAFGEAA